MTRIGGTKPPGGPDPTGPTPPEEPAAPRPREGSTPGRLTSKVADALERTPQLGKRLEALSAKAVAGRIQFTSEHLAEIAAAFAAVLRESPRADRKERARLFARAVLKHKRIGKLLESAPEAELESLFEAVAAQLDGSPVFAQLVDEVTEGARKIDLG